LDDGLYQNPYELVTFYDNHDMPRMNATDRGFVNANNWLFTSRGIPCIYYGSEANFSTGLKEHEGNRNYFGQARVNLAKNHVIHNNLTKIAHIRKDSIALQKGLQINLEFGGNTASFYRVYQNQDISQTALVLLNKSDAQMSMTVDKMLASGNWRDAANGQSIKVGSKQHSITLAVPANGVRVLLLDEKNSNSDLIREINRSMAAL
jgi:glycosidase